MAIKYITSDAAGGGDGTVETPYTLAEGAANCAGNEMHLAAGTYLLGADLTIAGSSNWIADGEVIIDGDDSYRVIIDDSDAATTITFTGTSATIIHFVGGDTDNVTVDSNGAALTVTFNYCKFHDNKVGGIGNGLTLAASPAGTITVTCNDCEAYNNDNDGFSQETSTNGANIWHKLYLNRCKGYSNTNGQGCTNHSTQQYLEAVSCYFYSNGASGYSNPSGAHGAMAYFYDCHFYENYTTNTNKPDVNSSGTSSKLRVENCQFSKLNGTNITSHIQVTGGTADIYNNVFYGATGQTRATEGVIYITGGNVLVRNNIIKDFTYNTSYCINLNAGSVYVINNTFVNNYRCFRFDLSTYVLRANIISGQTYATYACYELPAGNYNVDQFNGYNCWYNLSAATLFNSGNATYQATDVQVNPNLDSNYRPRNRTIARLGIGAVAPTAQTLGGTGILEIAP